MVACRQGLRRRSAAPLLRSISKQPVISLRSMKRKPKPGLPRLFNRPKYRQRSIIERMFGWQKENRRIVTRPTNSRKAMPQWSHWLVPCSACDISFRTELNSAKGLRLHVARSRYFTTCCFSSVTPTQCNDGITRKHPGNIDELLELSFEQHQRMGTVQFRRRILRNALSFASISQTTMRTKVLRYLSKTW